MSLCRQKVLHSLLEAAHWGPLQERDSSKLFIFYIDRFALAAPLAAILCYLSSVDGLELCSDITQCSY